jgi:2-(1,2-epoxy-1,2-dihydrophenyl)acetyl-CoA isomerase
MPDSDHLLVQRHEGVLTLTLNQPEKLNALSTQMREGLDVAFRQAESDAAVRAVVLTGAGRGFCSGADVTSFQTTDGEVSNPGDGLRRLMNPLVMRMRSMEKPVLAAINGVAAGAGLSLALACDLRYAAESARLVVVFSRIGLVPDAGSMYFLPRLVGSAKALELAWLADPISARDALDLGMLNQVLPDDEVLAFTHEIAARLARGPAQSIALIKRGLNQGHELSLEDVLEMEAQYQTIAASHSDFAEGVAAFKEKRPARFSSASELEGSRPAPR